MAAEEETPRAIRATDETYPHLMAEGKSLIKRLHILLRTAAVHDRANEALSRPVREFTGSLAALDRIDASWELRRRNDYLYLSEFRIRMDLQVFTSYQVVLDALKNAGVGTFALHGEPQREVLLDVVYGLLDAAKSPPGGDPFTRLLGILDRAREAGLVLAPPPEDLPDNAPDGYADLRQRSLTTFVKAIYLTGGMLESMNRNRPVDLRRAKRLVSSLVDILDLDESILLGMTTIKNYDEYTFNHSVNVCILCLAVGRRLGLSRHQLGDLGASALFHDLGKISLPQSLVSKPDKLDQEDWKLMKRHPVEGVKKLVRLKGVSEKTSRLILSVFRHHTNIDRSGYPPMPEGEEVPFFARIIRVVDSYDAMTSGRSYRKHRKCGAEALEEIWNLAGSHFDPGIVKVFISTVGIYPVGTLLQLSTGEIGLVIRNQREPELLDRPFVRVVGSWKNEAVAERECDLAADGPRVIGYFTETASPPSMAGYLFASAADPGGA